jgi:hypothetical protein
MMIGSTPSGCDELRLFFAMLLPFAKKVVGCEDNKVLRGCAMAAREDAEP